MAQNQRMVRLCTFLLLFALLALAIAPALAQIKPVISVNPVWRPGVQLDTDTVADAGNSRFVDVELYVSGNVQFWAADLTCTVNKAVLEGYTPAVGGPDLGDDVPMVRWNEGVWGGAGSYTAITTHVFDPATGKLPMTATRQGDVSPLGTNGQNYTFLLATLRFRVKALTANSNSTFTCTPIQFLDRNGVKVVATPTLSKTPNLTILNAGYVVKGKITYQAGKVPFNAVGGIGIDCISPTGPVSLSAIDTAGVFTFTTRTLGEYTCTYFGNKSNTSATRETDIFLGGTTFFNLSSSSLNLLPVTLRSGNVLVDGATGTATIGGGDLGELTAGAWPRNVTPAYTGGDINGDSKVNEIDLAILAGNYGLTENLDYSHMIFGLARDYVTISPPNSRIVWGDAYSGPVSSLVDSATAPDFWPQLSPDGAFVAFSRYNKTTQRYELFKAVTTTFPKGAVTQLTPKTGFTQDAFAPSWSPDGQRVAFICSNTQYFDFASDGWALNEGNLCVIDADGRNLRQVATGSKVFPPAWFNNDVVIYAGTDANATCAKDLCFYDFTDDTIGSVNTALATSTNVADMPLVQTFGGTTYLFYRFNDGVASKLRVGTATFDGAIFGGGIATTPVGGGNVVHREIVITGTGTQISTTLDYYDVSPDLNIVFYNLNSPVFQNSLYGGNFATGEWSNPATSQHTVDGYIGNATWSGVVSQATDLHALRATIDWVP